RSPDRRSGLRPAARRKHRMTFGALRRSGRVHPGKIAVLTMVNLLAVVGAADAQQRAKIDRTTLSDRPGPDRADFCSQSRVLSSIGRAVQYGSQRPVFAWLLSATVRDQRNGTRRNYFAEFYSHVDIEPWQIAAQLQHSFAMGGNLRVAEFSVI